MRLYDSKLAPNPRRVRIFMAEKGVVCDIVPVDIVKGENLDEAFLAVNPRGLLPTLVLDDGTVLDESVGICRYFEETHPEPPLLGTDPVDKARVEARQRHMEFDGLFAAAEAFRNAFPGFKNRRSSPGASPTSAATFGAAGADEAAQVLVARGKASMGRFYARLDAELATSRFVAGETFSIADITGLCAVDFATGAARVPVPDDCANVARWHAEVSARPSAKA